METQIWRKGEIVGNGRFEILQELGAGGVGITYLAYDRVKKQQIAIKTLNSNQQREGDFAVRQKKFEDEGFTLRGFRHPHIVRVYEKVELNGLLGYVMEYIPGQDLAKYVRNKGRLSETEALRYIDQVSLALEYVHQDNFLHRDVNPRNIMLRQDSVNSGFQEAILIDFGLAREFVELQPIYLSNTHGSELYKPIEQYEKRGIFGPPTDIYALAVTLYHLLNGAPLGSGKNWIAFTSISRKRNHEIGQGEECDRELWAELINVGVSARTLSAIQAGMAIEPEDRPKNMTEFRDLLGLLPATTPQIEISTLRFLEKPTASEYDYAEDISEPSLQPIVRISVNQNPQLDLTAAIPTKSTPTRNDQNLSEFSPWPGKKRYSKEDPLASLTTNSPTSEYIDDIWEESIREISSTSLPHTSQQLSKKILPISRRLILRGLVGTGGIAGFSFVGLLLKNLFNLQPAPKITSVSQPPGKSDATGITTIVQFTTVKLDNKGNVIARPTDKTQIIKEFLGNGVSLTMVKIPAGSFMMGSPLSEKELNEPQSDEKPQHKVNIKNYFYIGQTEVTQAQYQEIMNINPSEFKGSELPVENVSWHDAKEFCTKLSQQTSGIYSLPSESQWEYACKAGSTTPFAFGNTITTDVANYYGDYIYRKAPKGVYRQKTTVVTTFPPNAFGVFDMHGNVAEWCEDTWHDNYQEAPVDGSSWIIENNNNSKRLIRGGSYSQIPFHCRSATRSSRPANFTNSQLGFRVVYTPPA